MLTARTIRTKATIPRLVLLALFALGGTACADAGGLLPIDELPGASEEASEDPGAAEGDDEASEPAEEPSDAAADDADEAAADDDEAVEPITTEDIERICADEDASATTADELAPLVGTTPETFEELVCSSVAS